MLLIVSNLVFARSDTKSTAGNISDSAPEKDSSTNRAILVSAYDIAFLSQNSCGLTFDGAYLWIADSETKTAYRYDPISNTAVSTVPLPVNYPAGLTWDGSHLWTAQSLYPAKVFRFDPNSGAVVSSITLPAYNLVTLKGLCFDRSNFWMAIQYAPPIYINEILRVSENGSLLKTFPAKGNGPAGLAYDGVNIWHSDAITGFVYKLDPSSMAVLDSFATPGQTPEEMVWDGRYLWIIDGATDILYKFDVGTPRSLVISPASGSCVTTQAFDLVLTANAPGCTVTGGTVLFNGNDITSLLADLAITGTIDGDKGPTLRIPGIGVGKGLNAGLNILTATLHLSDGSIVQDTVEWEGFVNRE